MAHNHEFACSAAATLAIDLSKECPNTDDYALAECAWHAFKDYEAPQDAKLTATNYIVDVKRAMDAIRDNPAMRVEHGPELLEKARTALQKRSRGAFARKKPRRYAGTITFGVRRFGADPTNETFGARKEQAVKRFLISRFSRLVPRFPATGRRGFTALRWQPPAQCAGSASNFFQVPTGRALPASAASSRGWCL